MLFVAPFLPALSLPDFVCTRFDSLFATLIHLIPPEARDAAAAAQLTAPVGAKALVLQFVKKRIRRRLCRTGRDRARSIYGALYGSYLDYRDCGVSDPLESEFGPNRRLADLGKWVGQIRTICRRRPGNPARPLRRARGETIASNLSREIHGIAAPPPVPATPLSCSAKDVFGASRACHGGRGGRPEAARRIRRAQAATAGNTAFRVTAGAVTNQQGLAAASFRARLGRR